MKKCSVTIVVYWIIHWQVLASRFTRRQAKQHQECKPSDNTFSTSNNTKTSLKGFNFSIKNHLPPLFNLKWPYWAITNLQWWVKLVVNGNEMIHLLVAIQCTIFFQ
jgi:hypothetical protein